MNRDEVTGIVIKAISDLQEMSGALPQALTPATCPVDDLPDFDSLRGLETMILIEKEIGIKMPIDLRLFQSQDDGKALTISDAVDRLIVILGKKGGGKRG